MNVGQLVKHCRTESVGMITQIEDCPIAMRRLIYVLAPAISSKPMLHPYDTKKWIPIERK